MKSTAFEQWQHNLVHAIGLPAHAASYTALLKSAIFCNSLHGSGLDVRYAQPQPMTTLWQGLDREETYYSNLNTVEGRALLERWGWTADNISYDKNSWGFRSESCREFESLTGPSLITMGCSFTYGTGLPAHSIWPQLVADGLGLSLINLGTPGHGLTLGTRWLLDQGHSIADPQAIVILIPPSGRLSWLQRDGNNIIGNTFSMSEFERTPGIINDLVLNSFAQYTADYQSIQLWARIRNIPVYCFDGFGIGERGLARDLQHWGEPWHCAGAKIVLRAIKSS
jgi:hypothetical protein